MGCSDCKRFEQMFVLSDQPQFLLFDSDLTFLGPRGYKTLGTHFQLRFQLFPRRAQKLLWGD